MSNDSVLHRVAAGEPGAVQECIDRYRGLVWSIARRLAPTHAEAEDAMQDVFIALWKNADRFDPALGAEPTFVAMIARRRLIDRARRRGRRPNEAALIEEHASATLAAREPTGESELPYEVCEDARVAEQALGELTADQQRVILLSVYRGLSHDRIAIATGIPLGTVKTHIRRGLIKVRNILAERRASHTGNTSGRATGDTSGPSVEAAP